MVCVTDSSPNPYPPELPLAQPLNPDAAPYPPLPPATSKMGPWVLSKPYYRHQPVVYQLSPPSTLVYAPTGEGSFMSLPPFWAHYPTNYRLYYYHHYYYCQPKAVVGPPAGSAQEAVRGTTGHLPPRFSQRGKRGSMVPKQSTQSGPSSATSVIGKGKGKGKGKEKEEVDVDLLGKTTLMIKNVPNQFGRNDLMVIMDKHCLEENNKAMADGHPVWSSYDLLYLPMDFGKRANLGYAFVNFTTEVAAKRFWVAFNEFKWKVSRKTCEVTKAFIQGKEGFLKHFRNSVFPCHTNNYLPAVFRPPRDGVTRSKPTPVGRRSLPAKSST